MPPPNGAIRILLRVSPAGEQFALKQTGIYRKRRKALEEGGCVASRKAPAPAADRVAWFFRWSARLDWAATAFGAQDRAS